MGCDMHGMDEVARAADALIGEHTPDTQVEVRNRIEQECDLSLHITQVITNVFDGDVVQKGGSVVETSNTIKDLALDCVARLRAPSPEPSPEPEPEPPPPPPPPSPDVYARCGFKTFRGSFLTRPEPTRCEDQAAGATLSECEGWGPFPWYTSATSKTC